MNDQVEIEKEHVRQGEASGRMRKVVIISTLLAICIVPVAVYFQLKLFRNHLNPTALKVG
tara:strand:- start:1478 stop:1657 length:180 start_codon:yes stop_codon:yes gene_type:complete